MNPLGRRTPTDWDHVSRYPVRHLAAAPTVVNKVLKDSASWWDFYDQGAEGSCVGFGSSRMMSILNRQRYAARWLYGEAQLVDEWTDTPPAEGTSVRAAMDVLRAKGHSRVWRGNARPPALSEGIAENRWATTVDEIRFSISQDVPVTLGINWYSNFDAPARQPARLDLGGNVAASGDWWIGRGVLGSVRGGHAICCVAASDRRQAVALANSWGRSYPRKVWLPYATLGRLLHEDGEATLVTDRLPSNAIA